MISIQEMEQQAYTRDAELYNAIISLKRGDISAFDIIYQHTCKFMFYKAGQLLSGYYSKDSELKNDLVQDAYIKIFQGINSLQDGGTSGIYKECPGYLANTPAMRSGVLLLFRAFSAGNCRTL